MINGDIILDENYDLIFENGDYKIDDATYQQVQLILLSSKGWWKQTPQLGAGLQEQFNGELDREFLQKARLNLQADGFTVNTLKVTNEGLQVDVKR